VLVRGVDRERKPRRDSDASQQRKGRGGETKERACATDAEGEEEKSIGRRRPREQKNRAAGLLRDELKELDGRGRSNASPSGTEKAKH